MLSQSHRKGLMLATTGSMPRSPLPALAKPSQGSHACDTARGKGPHTGMELAKPSQGSHACDSEFRGLAQRPRPWLAKPSQGSHACDREVVPDCGWTRDDSQSHRKGLMLATPWRAEASLPPRPLLAKPSQGSHACDPSAAASPRTSSRLAKPSQGSHACDVKLSAGRSGLVRLATTPSQGSHACDRPPEHRRLRSPAEPLPRTWLPARSRSQSHRKGLALATDIYKCR